MIARVVVARVPASIAGTVGLVAVADLLLKVTDSAALFVVGDAARDLAMFTDTVGKVANATDRAWVRCCEWRFGL